MSTCCIAQELGSALRDALNGKEVQTRGVTHEHTDLPRWRMLRNPPAMQGVQEALIRSLGGEDPLEKEMAAPSSILAWRVPGTEEPGGCSPQGRRESDVTERLGVRACQHTAGSLCRTAD